MSSTTSSCQRCRSMLNEGAVLRWNSPPLGHSHSHRRFHRHGRQPWSDGHLHVSCFPYAMAQFDVVGAVPHNKPGATNHPPSPFPSPNMSILSVAASTSLSFRFRQLVEHWLYYLHYVQQTCLHQSSLGYCFDCFRSMSQLRPLTHARFALVVADHSMHTLEPAVLHNTFCSDSLGYDRHDCFNVS